MTYNIHPLFVHFPIALLFVYSVLRIVPLKRWFPTIAWREIEFTFLALGVMGAFVALSTGETAEHLVRPTHTLVEAHSFFATLATWMYGLLLSGEILAFLNKKYIPKLLPGSIAKLTLFLERLLTKRVVSLILALCGIVAISLTGLLGGVLVYGVTADPIAGTVLKILGISI